MFAWKLQLVSNILWIIVFSGEVKRGWKDQLKDHETESCY